jgi:hypothetical protein
MVSEDDEAFIADVVGVLERNLELLDCFEEWLRNKGLSARTIRTHIDNVERFVELYLINEGGSIGVPCSADEAAPADVDEFLAEWLPSGTERGLVATVTSHIASLKKFTICLREMGQMGAEESNEILALLREDRGYYIELARYLEEGPFGG